MNTESAMTDTISLLYVEDDADIRSRMAVFLERRIGQLLVAENGEQGLELFHAHKPDMVITDILMPVMDGLQMARTIRQVDPNIPIIITTAHNEEHYFLSSIELGIDRYVPKPIDPHFLMTAIEKCSRLLQRQREEERANRYVHFLLDGQPNFLLVTTDGELEYVNRAFWRFLGFETMESFQQADPDLGGVMITPDGRPLNELGDWQTLLADREQPIPIIYLSQGLKRKEERNQVPFAVTVSAFEEQRRLMFSFLDITDIGHEIESLRIQAYTDTLTGTCNRARLGGVLNAEIQRAQRHLLPLSIILCDIDHFKRVNDTHGHQAGDDVLQGFSRLIQENIRAEDVVARWGGEEFMIVCPQTDLEQSRRLSEKLCRVLAEHVFPGIGHITCSFGVAQCQPEDDTRTLTGRADKALYEAKSRGRNRVEIETHRLLALESG
ncbi:MAG: diguanylate cyclase [Sedimenticola sp.]